MDTYKIVARNRATGKRETFRSGFGLKQANRWFATRGDKKTHKNFRVAKEEPMKANLTP